MTSNSIIRPDLKLIADLIEPNTRVLDIGCADGELLAYLVANKQVDGRGIEISQDGVLRLMLPSRARPTTMTTVPAIGSRR